MLKDREKRTAEKYNIMGNIEKLHNDLLQIDRVTEVDFDLDGFYDNMRQVIVLTKYYIPVTLENYYDVRRELKQNVIEIAKENGLTRTEDAIEDYGEWFYFVFNHDDTWDKH